VTDAEILAAFSADYATARDRFRRAAGRLGWPLTAYETGDVGPRGEALTIDVAISAERAQTDRTLILSSGLHGVEGHFGSAVQVSALESFARDVGATSGVRCVFVHALNPSGFAWSRRPDAHNVDLNRAFRSAGMPVPGPDEVYRRLDGLLNPRRPPSRVDAFRLRLAWAALRHGTASLKRAVVSGQRVSPQGLFFAGTAAPPLQALLERELPALIGGASQVMHLDLHTGLGRSGEGILIVDHPISDESRAWMVETFGAVALREALRDPHAYIAGGSLGYWCLLNMTAPRYRFAFAEFGTYGGPDVLAGLRKENQAHHWADPSDLAVGHAKARLRELFCPRDPVWRTRTVRGALDLVSRAIRGLADDTH
jgi:Protein of unknown function (DUF2817)